MKKLNGKKYAQMLMLAGINLENNKEKVNDLNVFPVPDGDTGYNMNMTIQSGVEAIRANNEENIGQVSKNFSKGLLMGARGNSGVILSQFFRGVSEGLENKNEVTVEEFHQALETGVKRAYSSIIKVVEGTILTVVREMTENTTNFDLEFEQYFEELYKNAYESLKNTPELLPVLKEVGVVDSGGAGFLAILEGMLFNLRGQELEIKEDFVVSKKEEHNLKPEEIIFGYCTEMLIKLKNKDQSLNEVRAKLETFGDSIVCIIDDDVLKMHVHTEEPIKVFEYGLTMGDIIHVKSENMRIQAEEAQKKEVKNVGFVSVVSSEEMGALFKEANPEIELITGGQTLNPSIEDIVKAIINVNAKEVFVFPNNSNIIMAAEAARDMIEDIEVHVIKTKHMTQALECLWTYSSDLNVAETLASFNEIIDAMINIEITNSIKDTKIGDVEIAKDDYMVITNGQITSSVKTLKEALNVAIDYLLAEDAELITIFSGKDSDRNLTQEIIENVEEKSPFIDINNYDTNQNVYHYIIGGIK